MFTDLRRAVRILRQAPGFTPLVVIVLAIGSACSVAGGAALSPVGAGLPGRRR